MAEKKAEKVVEPVKPKLTNEQRNELKRKRRARLQTLKQIQVEAERLRAEKRVVRLQEQRAARRVRKAVFLEEKMAKAAERKAYEASLKPLVVKHLPEVQG